MTMSPDHFAAWMGVLSIPLLFLVLGCAMIARTIDDEVRTATQPGLRLAQETAMEATNARCDRIQNVESVAALLNYLSVAMSELKEQIESNLSGALSLLRPKVAALRVPFNTKIVSLLFVGSVIVRSFVFFLQINVKAVDVSIDEEWLRANQHRAIAFSKLAVMSELLCSQTALAVMAGFAVLWIASLFKPAGRIEEEQDHSTAAETVAPSRVSHADANCVRFQDNHSDESVREESPVIDLTVTSPHSAAPSLDVAGIARDPCSLAVGELSPLSESVDSASPTDAVVLVQEEITVNALVLNVRQNVSESVVPLLPPIAVSNAEEQQLPSSVHVQPAFTSPPPLESANGVLASNGPAAEEQHPTRSDGSGEMDVAIEPDFGGVSTGDMEDELQPEQEPEQAPTQTFSLGGKNGDQADRLSKRKKCVPRQTVSVSVSEEEMERKYDEAAPAGDQTSAVRRSVRKRRKTSIDGHAVSTSDDEKSAGSEGAAQRESGRKRGRDAIVEVIHLLESDGEQEREQAEPHDAVGEEEKDPLVPITQAHSGPSANGPPVYATRSVTPRLRASASHSPPRRRAHATAILPAAAASLFSTMRRRSMDDGEEEAEYYALATPWRTH